MKKLFPLVTADVALFTMADWQLRVLVVKREHAPASETWALPGGILRPDLDKSLNDTARRALRSKTGVDAPYLEQVITVSGPERDPRGWSISTLYYALLPGERVPAVAGMSVKEIKWGDPEALQQRLAFDHGVLLQNALAALQFKVQQGALPLHLLPEKFTLTDVQRACEAVLGHRLDKGAFRRLIKDEPCLLPVPGEFLRGPQRPAQLFRASEDFEFQPRRNRS
jgi:ADP-ribose pyrophosphatase YjhB (NUDIX family)